MRQVIARLNWRVNLVELRLVKDHILRDHFNQVVRGDEAPICLLNQTTKDVGYVVVGLVSISKLLSLPTNSANRMVTSPEKSPPLLRKLLVCLV